MNKDVELEILLEVIFSNTTKENITNTHENLIKIINERYKKQKKRIKSNIVK